MNETTTTNMKVCANSECKTEFKPKKKWQLYCSPKCSNKIRMGRYWAKRLAAPSNAPANP